MDAFYNCDSLTSVTIPASVTSIQDYAFYGCDNLEVYFTGNAPSFGYDPFDYGTTLYYHTGATGWDKVISNGLAWVTIEESAHICPEYTYDNNHTCTLDGTERGTCMVCGALDVRTVEGSAAHRMRYTANGDATCTTDGTKTGVCMLCGETETVADPGSATGHDYSEYSSNQDATCTADGTKTAVCSNCGDQKTITEEGTALGHSFTDYVSNNNYTCTPDGTETAHCDSCDATDTRVEEGTAAHRYFEGSCIFCGEAEEPEEPVIPGDVNGDGRLNIGDVVRIYSHTRGTAMITDPDALARADFNGDGRINVGDAVRAYAQIRNS